MRSEEALANQKVSRKRPEWIDDAGGLKCATTRVVGRGRHA